MILWSHQEAMCSNFRFLWETRLRIEAKIQNWNHIRSLCRLGRTSGRPNQHRLPCYHSIAFFKLRWTTNNRLKKTKRELFDVILFSLCRCPSFMPPIIYLIWIRYETPYWCLSKKIKKAAKMRVKYVSLLPRMPNINFGLDVTCTYKKNILAAVLCIILYVYFWYTRQLLNAPARMRNCLSRLPFLITSYDICYLKKYIYIYILSAILTFL
jgi:hypothetical protein